MSSIKQIHTIYLPDLLQVTDLTVQTAKFGKSTINNLKYTGLEFKDLIECDAIFNSHNETFIEEDGANVIHLPSLAPIKFIISVSLTWFGETEEDNQNTFYIQCEFDGVDWVDNAIFLSTHFDFHSDFTPECKFGIDPDGKPCIFIGDHTDNFNCNTLVEINYIITEDISLFDGWNITKEDGTNDFTNLTDVIEISENNIIGNLEGSFLRCFDRFMFEGEDFIPENDEDFITRDWADDNIVYETVGDVSSLGGSVDNNFVVFDGITGKIIKDSGVNVVDKALVTNVLTLNNNTPFLPASDYEPVTKKNVLDEFTINNPTVWYGFDRVCLSGEITEVDKISYNGDSGYVGHYTLKDLNNKDNARTGIIKCILSDNVVDVYQEAFIEHDPSEAGDKYGFTVDIAGNTACVGAPYRNDGVVFVYTRYDGIWTLQQELTITTSSKFGCDLSLNEAATVLVVRGSDVATIYTLENNLFVFNCEFEISSGHDDQTTISNSGDTICIGLSLGNDENPVLILKKIASTWVLSQEIYQPSTIEEERFGIKVKLSGDGKTLVISSIFYDELDSNVRIYKSSGGNFTLFQTINSAYPLSRFGEGQGINYDGSVIAIGADKSDNISFDNGIIYVYKSNGGSYSVNQTIRCSSQDTSIRFGRRIEFSNDGRVFYTGTFLADVGDEKGAGSVYGYKLQDNGYYSEFVKLSSDPIQRRSRFGETISISKSGFDLIVGSNERDEPENNSGGAFIFTTPINELDIIKIDTGIGTDNVEFKFGREGSGVMNLQIDNLNTNDWELNLERIVI